MYIAFSGTVTVPRTLYARTEEGKIGWQGFFKDCEGHKGGVGT